MSFYNGTNGFAHPGDAGQLPPTSSSTSSPASQQAQAQAQAQAQVQDPQGQPKPSGRQLSCALCQRRKIKCDRTTPCSNCVKANVVCTPSTPAPPRQRMRPRRDLQERLARCESLLRQYSEADRAASGDVFSPMAMSASGASTPNGGLGMKTYQMQGGSEKKSTSSTPSGRIVEESAITGPGGVRFVDGQFWEQLNDEISNMKRLIDSEDPEGAIPPYDHQKEFEQTSNCPSPQSDEKPSLDPVQAFKLWQIFLDRVNPLIKIIHAPTLQPLLVQAATDITSVPLDYQALLYSIFGLATISLSDDEANSIVGCDRDQAAHRFTKGTFHALTRFDFLRRYNMVVLQAMVHILIILQSQYNRHASWVLSGSLIRVAISMGYHRDGDALKLPPFETEMRRRIWWQIVNNDLTLTLDCGYKHLSIPKDFDTKQPLNLNDADMYPDASGELRSREGPTEMAFVLVLNRITQYMLDEESRLTVESTILGQGTPETPLDPYLLERSRLFTQSLERDLLEIEQRFLSPTAGNAHLAALGFRPHLIDRLNDMVRPMTEAPEWGGEVQGPKDNLFKLLLTTNENIGDAYLYMKEWGFGWYIRMHFRLEILATLSSFMYQKPLSNFADRSWRMFEIFYREFPEIGNLDQRAYLAQAQFTLKAWDAREQAYHSSGSMLQVPDFIVQLRQKVQQHGTPGASGASRRPMDDARVMDAQQQQGDVQMPQGMPMQDQPLSFMAEEQMGGNSVHSNFLTWDFAGDMGGMGALGDMNGIFGPYDDGSGGGPNPFQ